MSPGRPDFENWSDEEFDRRADEVCAYVHSLDLNDAEWMSGAEYRLRLAAERTDTSEGSADEPLRSLVVKARADGSSWDRVGKMLGTSAADARKRFGGLDQRADFPTPVD